MKNGFVLEKFGIALLEVFMVVAIMAVILSAVFTSLSSSRVSFQNSSNQIERMENARKAADRIAWELKESNPSWLLNSTSYAVIINAAGDRIDFYLPIFDENNQVSQLKAVRYYTGGLNNAQLLRREGTAITVVANNIDITTDQKPYFDFNNTEHTIIDIRIPILKNNSRFTLSSQANLRNRETELGEGVTIAEIIEQ